MATNNENQPTRTTDEDGHSLGYETPSRKEHEIYVFAKCETFVDDYARSHAIPSYEFARRIFKALYEQADRQVLGTIGHMSSMQQPPPEGSETLAEMALASGPQPSVQGVKKKYRKIYVDCPECGKEIVSRSFGVHMYTQHGKKGIGIRGLSQTAEKKPRKPGSGNYPKRMMKCKQCSKLVSNHQMANHVRFAHPQNKSKTKGQGNHRVTAEGRRRMARAQQERWRKIRTEQARLAG